MIIIQAGTWKLEASLTCPSRYARVSECGIVKSLGVVDCPWRILISGARSVLWTNFLSLEGAMYMLRTKDVEYLRSR